MRLAGLTPFAALFALTLAMPARAQIDPRWEEPLAMPREPTGEALGEGLVESDAVLRRIGAGPVRAAGISGLTWVTIDPVGVTIRIRPARKGLWLRELPAAIWPELTGTLTLAGAVAQHAPRPWIDVPTAGRAAAGTVLVLSDAAGHTAFRITGSATALSPQGTKVELVGRVRREPIAGL